MNQEQLSQIGYDCVLPSAIFFNKNLCPSCIRLYAMVRNLTKVHGYCFATNEYLSNLLEVDERSIQRQLKALKKEKFIQIYTEKNKIHWQRRIYISDDFQKMFTKRQICHPPTTNLSPIKEENSKKNSSSKATPSLTQGEPLPSAASKERLPNDDTFKLISAFTSGMKNLDPKFIHDPLQTTEVFSSMQKENPSLGVEEMCAAINFLFEMEDPYWRKGIRDALSFKKAFPAILNQMRQMQASQKYENTKKINRSIAKQVVKHFKMQSKSNQYLDEDQAFARKLLKRFLIERDGVFDKQTELKINFSIENTLFLQELNKIFDIQFQE